MLSGGVDRNQCHEVGKSKEIDAEFSLVQGEQSLR